MNANKNYVFLIKEYILSFMFLMSLQIAIYKKAKNLKIKHRNVKILKVPAK